MVVDICNKLETTSIRPSKDQIVEVIGETGRWQLEKILIVFLVSIPGLAHIFVSAFVAPKQDFWCEDDLPENYTYEDVTEKTKVITNYATAHKNLCFLML